MKNLVILLIVSMIFTLTCCEKDPFTCYQGSFSKDMLINNDPLTLNKRILFANEPLFYSFQDPSLLKGSPNSSIDIQVIAGLESPKYGQEVLQASHIRIADGYAYIAYNTQGPRYLGGVDIVDIRTAINPRLISNVIFIDPETNTGKDVSSVDIEPKRPGSNNFIWIAGAEEANPLLESPAIVERLALNSGNQFESSNNPRQFFDLKGYVGTDIKFFNDKIYVTSGTGGGLTILNHEMNQLDFYSIENARSVDVNNSYTISLAGNPGHMYAPGLWDTETGGATDPEAKSMVRLCYETHGMIVTKGSKCTGNFALVALGEEGLKCFNLDKSVSVACSFLPRPLMPVEGNEWDYVTNGVSVSNGGWVYIANGAGGLDIAKMDLYGKLTLLGNVELGASVNFVEASDNFLFVATGTGGLTVLKVKIN